MGHSDEREIYSTKCSHLEKSESLKLVIKIAFSKNEKHSKINPKPEKGRKQNIRLTGKIRICLLI